MAARILIADDNEINREFLHGVLRREHCTLVQATNGREAVAACRRQPFDLILMDIRMPEVDGITATGEIRALPGFDQIPILALTADLQLQQGDALAGHGFTATLLKPVSKVTLLEAVRGYTTAFRPAADDDAARSPVDRRAGLAATGGNEELLARLTTMLGRELARLGPEVDRRVAAGEHDAARELAHKLHASAGYCGARELQDAAGTLEQALAAGTGVADAAEAFRRACDRLARHLGARAADQG